MPRICSWLAIGFFMLVAGPSVSASSAFFGPKTYTSSAGKPQRFTEAFNLDSEVACEGRASFALLVQNDGVASGSIALNGVMIMTERDFAPGRATFESPIALAAQNVLDIELKGGRPGTSITLSIRRDLEEMLAPEKTYTLRGGRETFRETLAVPDPDSAFVLLVRNGDPSGANRVGSAAISINGHEVIAENGFHSGVASIQTQVVLQSVNTLVVNVSGGIGAMLTVALKRRLPEDACGPGLEIAEPVAGAQVSTARILVAGTVTGPPNVSVTVNGFLGEIDTSHAGTPADPFRWFAEIPAARVT